MENCLSNLFERFQAKLDFLNERAEVELFVRPS